MFSFDMTCTFCNAVFEIDKNSKKKKKRKKTWKTQDIPISMATDVLHLIFFVESSPYT